MTANLPSNLAQFQADIQTANQGGAICALLWPTQHPDDAFSWWLRQTSSEQPGYLERVATANRWEAIKDVFGQAWLAMSARRALLGAPNSALI